MRLEWVVLIDDQTRNAPLLARSRFGVVSLQELSSLPRCIVRSFFDGNTYISFQNTPDTKRDIRIWQHMFLRLFVWRKEIQ